MLAVAETSVFQRKIAHLLSEHEYEDLVSYLSEHPAAGVVMEGTGGIRKLRWARAGGGKSGGIRVIYYYYDESMPLYLLTVFGKNERADLSKKERNFLARMVKELVASWRWSNGQSIH